MLFACSAFINWPQPILSEIDDEFHDSLQLHYICMNVFDVYNVQAENIKAQKLAIDRPSHKFISFLQKHYGLKSTIPQVNNFVVFDGFFGDRHGMECLLSGTLHLWDVHVLFQVCWFLSSKLLVEGIASL